MATFLDVQKEHEKDWEKPTVGEYLLDQVALGAQVSAFLDQHGFTDLEFIGKGNGAIALRDKTNPSLVIRICPDFDDRPVVPQMVQSIYTQTFILPTETFGVNVEILPNLERKGRPLGIQSFTDEVEASGYEINKGSPIERDVGVFSYTNPDSSARGQKKYVTMAMDPSLLVAGDKPSVCTADYPTLDIQWEEQRKLVEADERLKKLLPEGPKKFPATKVIPSVGYGSPQ